MPDTGCSAGMSSVARVLVAAFGVVTVLAVLLLLWSEGGKTAAVATALLVAFWPEHVAQCQQNRFYVFAALFSFTTMLLGARFVRRPTVALALLITATALGGLLCHTLTAVSFALVVMAIIAASVVERRPVPRAALGALIAGGVVLAAFAGAYILPLLRGWNSAETFGFSAGHALVSMLRMFEWPLLLWIVAGGLLALVRYREAINTYWLVCSVGCVGACLCLPCVFVYHGSYLFPMCLGPLVLAGFALATVHEAIRKHSPVAAHAWLGLMCLVALPSLLSHYLDGSRSDLRAAANYVKREFHSGDRVTGFSMGAFDHYAGNIEPRYPLSHSQGVAQLARLAAEPGKLWIVVESAASSPLSEDLAKWLGVHCRHEFHLEKRRLDDRRFAVDVFAYPPAAAEGNLVPVAVGP